MQMARNPGPRTWQCQLWFGMYLSLPWECRFTTLMIGASPAIHWISDTLTNHSGALIWGGNYRCVHVHVPHGQSTAQDPTTPALVYCVNSIKSFPYVNGCRYSLVLVNLVSDSVVLSNSGCTLYLLSLKSNCVIFIR